uniref:High-affinity choline uptake protein BetT n=1 Tax=Macrostomum lignano TaxID=282301 RepID=A0A1I8FPD8_9PLAT
MVMVSLIVSVYYNVVVAQCLYFLALSFTLAGFRGTIAVILGTATGAQISYRPTLHQLMELAESGFRYAGWVQLYFQQHRPGNERIEHFGSVNWFVLLALFIAWVIVALVLLKGVQSLASSQSLRQCSALCQDELKAKGLIGASKSHSILLSARSLRLPISPWASP